MFFMSFKSFHDFKTVPIQNQMNPEATENELQKQLLPHPSTAQAKSHTGTWETWLRAGGAFSFSLEVLYFITGINILKGKKIFSVNLFSLMKKACLEISVKHPFLFSANLLQLRYVS